jgi:hypothetical protein
MHVPFIQPHVGEAGLENNVGTFVASSSASELRRASTSQPASSQAAVHPFSLQTSLIEFPNTSNNLSTANIALYSHAWPRYKHLEPNLLEDIMIDLCALNDPEHISFS